MRDAAFDFAQNKTRRSLETEAHGKTSPQLLLSLRAFQMAILCDHANVLKFYPNPFYFIIAIAYGLILCFEYAIGVDGLCGKWWLAMVELMDYNKTWILMSAVPYFCFAYWYLAGVFLIYDWCQRPKVISTYKVQPGTNEPLDKKKLAKTVAFVLFNQLVMNSLAYGFIAFLFEWTQTWDYFDVTTIPSFPRLMFNLIVCSMIYDLIFYFNHRLLHHKLLYKHIHKIHHEWNAPIAAAAVYSHPVEHIFCNVIPLCGPFILQTDVASSVFFANFIMVTTCFIHCGLQLPFMMSPVIHDFHHKHFVECFSTNGLPDHIFGTSKAFLKSVQAKKHKTLLGFKSMNDSVGDSQIQVIKV